MLTLIAALMLAAPPAPLAPSPGDASTEVPAAPARPAEPSGWQGSRTLQVVAYVALEGLFVGSSALAARWPQPTGWVLVGTAPLGYLNMQRGDTLAATTVGVTGTMGLGLYDALELRGQRYSRGQRFWINLAAWHTLALATQLTHHLTREERPSAAPALAIGVGADGPVLRLAGRF